MLFSMFVINVIKIVQLSKDGSILLKFMFIFSTYKKK